MDTRPRNLSTFIEKLPIFPDRPAVAYASTMLLCVIALLLRWELDSAFPPGYPYLTFFPAVIISSFLFGVRPGMLAAVTCGLFAWYFFIPPRLTFAIDSGVITALLFYAGVVIVDVALVHLMQVANSRVIAAREEVRQLADERGRLAERNKVLFQELQHRVGNNLQMVGALLALQLRNLQEPEARRAISDAAQRLQVIGSIQRSLYNPDGERVPLDRFVGNLANQIKASNGRSGIAWHVAIEPGIILRPESAVPVALILSEAIANALEHGFHGRAEGRIDIRSVSADGAIVLMVRDDGAGLPAGFTPDPTASMGLRISRVLADQLRARYALEPCETGTVMRLELPVT